MLQYLLPESLTQDKKGSCKVVFVLAKEDKGILAGSLLVFLLLEIPS